MRRTPSACPATRPGRCSAPPCPAASAPSPRGGRFVLVTSGAHDGKVYGTQGARRDRPAVERWASGRRTAPLVRPDGYLASAADTADPAAVEAALVAHVG